ncbi:MAG: DUF1476 domain-containing protein [Caulobacteraceae bacterium]
MSSLDDREKGFERKFASDQELEFRAASRRNRMLGEWAGRLMGLESVDDYAQAVVKSHLEHPGDEDTSLRPLIPATAKRGAANAGT